MTTLAVTVTQTAAASNGMGVLIKVITGASASQPGAVAGSQSTNPNQSITPGTTGSWIYGAILISGVGAPGVQPGTTFQQDVTGTGLNYVAMRSTNTQTSGTPITMGSTDAGDGLDISCVEIKPSGTLAEDASAPAASGFVNGTTFTSASFNPPAGALLVVMIATNGAAGTTTVSVSDTSGLTWTAQQQENGNSKGYSGVWTAQIAAAVAAGGGISGFGDSVTANPSAFSAAL